MSSGVFSPVLPVTCFIGSVLTRLFYQVLFSSGVAPEQHYPTVHYSTISTSWAQCPEQKQKSRQTLPVTHHLGEAAETPLPEEIKRRWNTRTPQNLKKHTPVNYANCYSQTWTRKCYSVKDVASGSAWHVPPTQRLNTRCWQIDQNSTGSARPARNQPWEQSLLIKTLRRNAVPTWTRLQLV